MQVQGPPQAFGGPLRAGNRDCPCPSLGAHTRDRAKGGRGKGRGTHFGRRRPIWAERSSRDPILLRQEFDRRVLIWFTLCFLWGSVYTCLWPLLDGSDLECHWCGDVGGKILFTCCTGLLAYLVSRALVLDPC